MRKTATTPSRAIDSLQILLNINHEMSSNQSIGSKLLYVEE